MYAIVIRETSEGDTVVDVFPAAEWDTLIDAMPGARVTWRASLEDALRLAQSFRDSTPPTE